MPEKPEKGRPGREVLPRQDSLYLLSTLPPSASGCQGSIDLSIIEIKDIDYQLIKRQSGRDWNYSKLLSMQMISRTIK